MRTEQRRVTPPRSPRKQVNLDPEVHALLMSYARQHGHSVKWVVERLVRESLIEIKVEREGNNA